MHRWSVFSYKPTFSLRRFFAETPLFSVSPELQSLADLVIQHQTNFPRTRSVKAIKPPRLDLRCIQSAEVAVTSCRFAVFQYKSTLSLPIFHINMLSSSHSKQRSARAPVDDTGQSCNCSYKSLGCV